LIGEEDSVSAVVVADRKILGLVEACKNDDEEGLPKAVASFAATHSRVTERRTTPGLGMTIRIMKTASTDNLLKMV
jgi:hypothetical protein